MAYKKKYQRGEPITSLDDLAKEEFVFLPCGVRHCGFVQSMQFRLLKNMVNTRRIHKAVKTNG